MMSGGLNLPEPNTWTIIQMMCLEPQDREAFERTLRQVQSLPDY